MHLAIMLFSDWVHLGTIGTRSGELATTSYDWINPRTDGRLRVMAGEAAASESRPHSGECVRLPSATAAARLPAAAGQPAGQIKYSVT
jgi:hypothetical protein